MPEISPETTKASVPKTVKRTGKSIEDSISKAALAQIKEWLKKFVKIVSIAGDRDMNESDTSNIINDFLGEVLGYDKFFDVTTEYKIRGQYADYGVKIDDKLAFIIEVKAIKVGLNDNHIFQAASYASTEGVEWVILTNLKQWNVYHLSFWSRIDQELVLSFDFDDAKSVKFLWNVAHLHKESFKKWFLKNLWNQRVAMSGNNFRKVLCSQPVLKVIQRELSKASGIKIGENDISAMLDDLLTKK